MAVDVCVVGGGIVGLATAHALICRDPDLKIVLIEKERAWARHQTGHNSGVIHSGIYYRPDGLKARLSRRGLNMMYEFCAANDVPVERCGKVIVTSKQSDLGALDALFARGVANGVDVTRISAEELHEREPHVAGLAGLYVADTGITDYRLVAEKLVGLLRGRGVDLRLGVTARSMSSDGRGVTVSTDDGEIRASRAVAAAGLHSDELARASGALPVATIVPFRGEYYELGPGSTHLVRGLVYPVPDPSLPFLGVHLTRSIHGGVHVGPNAVPALSRDGYRRRDVSPRMVLQLISTPALWKLYRRHWRTGFQEISRSLVKPLFVTGVRQLLPDVRSRGLVSGHTGVRAQAVDAGGQLVDDFLFQEDGNCLHVINAPSPAATASLAIGEEIADKVLRGF